MKKVLVTLLVLVLAFSVIGIAKTKITYFGDNDPNSAEAVLTKLFNSSQDEIEVEFLLQSWSTDDKHTALVTRFGAKDPNPTVYLGDVIWPAEFAAAGWALDLTPYFPKSEQDMFLPGTIKSATYLGKIYAFPSFTDGGLLYYRTDLLEKYGYKPPTTWEELKTIAIAVSQKEGIDGFVFQGAQYEGLVCDAVEFIASNGGEVIDGNGNVKVNTPEVIEALSFMRELVTSGAAPDKVFTFMEEDARMAFQQGKAVFMRNWPYCHSPSNMAGDQSAVKGKYGMIPMPKGPKGTGGAATLGGWMVFVNPFASKTEQEAGVQFAKFMTSESAQTIRNLVAGNAPTRKAVYSNPMVLRANAIVETLYPIMINAVPRPVTPFYAQVSNALQEEFHAVLTGKKTASDAAKAIEKKIKEIYE
jgi:multiple sugar transport system substrate-binding protein